MPSSVSRFLLVVLAPLALASSCATTTEGARAADASPPDASLADLARDADARRTVALEVAHLDGLDVRVQALSSLHDVVAQGLRGAHLRDLDAPRLSLDARGRLAEIRRVTRDTYREDSLRAELAHRLAERPGAARLGEVLAFLRSSSWKRLSEARAYIRTPAGQKALGAFLAQIASRPPDERRLSRVKELLRASREVDLMSALSFTATRAVLEATEGALPRELARGYDRWLESQQETAASFEQSVTRTLLLQDYFALHALDDRQLDEVLAFWRSDAGRWWANARVDETRDLVEQRALQLKEELRRRTTPPPEDASAP